MATRADLNGIKTELKSIFDAANTTTASPIDLSSGLANQRVQKVLTVHPDMIRPQASFYPFVTCYIEDKSTDSDQISGNQLNMKRTADIKIKIVGAVYNQNFTDATKDPADNDINYLMENVELVLRSSPNLNGKVSWQRPDGCVYFTMSDQKNNVRCGVLTLSAKVHY